MKIEYGKGTLDLPGFWVTREYHEQKLYMHLREVYLEPEIYVEVQVGGIRCTLTPGTHLHLVADHKMWVCFSQVDPLVVYIPKSHTD